MGRPVSIIIYILPPSLTSSTDDRLLVLAIPLEISAIAPDNILTRLGDLVPHISEEGQKVDISNRSLNLEPVNLFIKSGNLSQYSGSLTTPPCVEGVTFVISKTPMDIGLQMYKNFKSVMKFNSRILEGPPGSVNIIEVAGAV